MRVLSLFFIFTICAVTAFADGLISMKLERVLQKADIIVLAEIISNDVTIVESIPEKGKHSVTYTCDIRAKVCDEVKSTISKEIRFSFQVTLIKGIWHEHTGTGLERHMKAKENYVLLLTSQDDKLILIRAEKETELDSIKKLLKQPQSK